jgi:hypothetical protein
MDPQYMALCEKYKSTSLEGVEFTLIPPIHSISDQQLYVKCVKNHQGRIIGKEEFNNEKRIIKENKNKQQRHRFQYNFDSLLDLGER